MTWLNVFLWQCTCLYALSEFIGTCQLMEYCYVLTFFWYFCRNECIIFLKKKCLLTMLCSGLPSCWASACCWSLCICSVIWERIFYYKSFTKNSDQAIYAYVSMPLQFLPLCDAAFLDVILLLVCTLFVQNLEPMNVAVYKKKWEHFIQHDVKFT